MSELVLAAHSPSGHEPEYRLDTARAASVTGSVDQREEFTR